MNKFKLYFLLISVTFVLFSCNKSDTVASVPLREYGVQNSTDKETIENYLRTYYIESVMNHPGFTDDQDVKLTKIPVNGSQPSIMSLLDSPTFPKLSIKKVRLHDIDYEVYYLKFRADNDVDGKSPCRVDEVLAAYSGSYLTNKSTTTNSITVTDITSTVFETVLYPQQRLALDRTIRGWAEIFPLFKTGSFDATPSPDPASYLNFGAGVMFLPSGLAYYNVTTSTIPAYSSLVFSFKLYDMKRADQDGDGILSVDEDLNGDGDFTNDDTDGDGVQNYLDIDDDGDGYLTKNEIKINGVLPTSYDLIQDCSGTTNGIKKHLNKTCH
ncbi:FKBP-type peptidylprolyl isomerase [Flavobacterium psychrotolerans]|uniref:FKBP-type peptidylprolyl isomerase n=1 Tax=Flavobacterium psychrotolerans TaxID=2169410 RepID=A0A2U1JJK4_9FLAO|nr:FKBP-type peptidylprolyl isomerase [Flavobacterium psychrotolerans]PWA05346.1 FKBP-type peptidylprolyl isomerase [Flavobacterium psychrotolerans]